MVQVTAPTCASANGTVCVTAPLDANGVDMSIPTMVVLTRIILASL
jgi:hypothetical protein